MDNSQRSRFRLLAGLLLAGFVALAGLAAWWPDSPGGNPRSGGRWLNRQSYDLLHSLAAIGRNPLADSSVVIVFLDMASFAHERLDPIQPWPRSLHARLLHRGARGYGRCCCPWTSIIPAASMHIGIRINF